MTTLLAELPRPAGAQAAVGVEHVHRSAQGRREHLRAAIARGCRRASTRPPRGPRSSIAAHVGRRRGEHRADRAADLEPERGERLGPADERGRRHRAEVAAQHQPPPQRAAGTPAARAEASAITLCSAPPPCHRPTPPPSGLDGRDRVRALVRSAPSTNIDSVPFHLASEADARRTWLVWGAVTLLICTEPDRKHGSVRDRWFVALSRGGGRARFVVLLACTRAPQPCLGPRPCRAAGRRHDDRRGDPAG
jgi:hypothetical protein